MRFPQLVVMIILIGMFVGGTVQYIDGYNKAYTTSISAQDISSIDDFVKIEDLQQNISTTNSNLQANSGIEELDALTVITQGVIGGAKIIGSTPVFLINMATAGFKTLVTRLGISIQFLYGIIALITFAVSMFIIYLLMKIKA